MWRHEDVWRTLGGGVNFVTGEPLENEYAQAEMGTITGGMVRLCLAPLIHGNAQWAALMALYGGDTVVLLPQFDPDVVWQTVQRRKVNVIVLIGDAMARPMIEAFVRGDYDASSVFAVSSSAALFSQTVKDQYLEQLPNSVVTDAVGSSETGFMGIGMVTKDGEQAASGGPRVKPTEDCIIIDELGAPLADRQRRDRPAGARRLRPPRLLQGPREDRRAVRRDRRQALHGSRRLRPLRGRRHDHAARTRQRLREHRRREGVPRRGRERAHGAPGRVRRARDRRPRRAPRPAGRGRRAAA